MPNSHNQLLSNKHTRKSLLLRSSTDVRCVVESLQPDNLSIISSASQIILTNNYAFSNNFRTDTLSIKFYLKEAASHDQVD